MKAVKFSFFYVLILCSLTAYAQPTINADSNPLDGSKDVRVNLDMAEVRFDKPIYLSADTTVVTVTDLPALIKIKSKSELGVENSLSINVDYTLETVTSGKGFKIVFKKQLLPKHEYEVEIQPVRDAGGALSTIQYYNFTTAPYVTINNVLTTDICKGGYINLNNIVIYEGGSGNFQYDSDAGNYQFIRLDLPNGFEFKKDEGDVTATSNADITFFKVGGTNKGLLYDLGAHFDTPAPPAYNKRQIYIVWENSSSMTSAATDTLTISGLKVKVSDNASLLPFTTYNITASANTNGYTDALLLGITGGASGTSFARMRIKNLPELNVNYSNNTTGDGGSSINICTTQQLKIEAQSGFFNYSFNVDGQEVSNGGGYSITGGVLTTSSLSAGPHTFKVTAEDGGGCVYQSATRTIEFGATPILKITDGDNIVTDSIQDGDEYAMPNDGSRVLLEANPKSEFPGSISGGRFVGEGVESFIVNDTVTYYFNPANPDVGNRPGRYPLYYRDDSNECFSTINFYINLFKANSEQILGIQNSGICIDSEADKILIGWAGQGTVGKLYGETDAIKVASTSRGIPSQVVQGKLNPAYDKGLLSGFELSPSILAQEGFVAGDTLTFEITYKPLGDTTGVVKTVTQDITIVQAPDLVTTLLGGNPIQNAYCESSSSIQIIGDPPGGLGTSKSFRILNLDSASDVSDAVPLENLTLFFDPADTAGLDLAPQNFLAPNNNGYVVIFNYISEYGCDANRMDTVRILPLPDSVFTDIRVFNYCIGDNIENLFVAEVDSVVIADSLQYLWYDDRKNLLHENSYSYNTGISNQFPSTTSYFVSQRLVDQGCIGPLSELKVNVGENPEAKFKFAESCASGTVSFTNESEGGIVPKDTISQWYWSFNDPEGATGDSSDQPNPYYAFSGPGVYEVMLKVSTSVGCSDSVKHVVATYSFPAVDLTNNVYLETFEQGANGWISTTETNQANGLASNSSWRLAIPEGDSINDTQSGNHAWITSDTAITAYNDNEDSWVESPCFNLDLWDKPKAEMDIWYDTEKFEGATLQYAIKEDVLNATETKWEPVGINSGGIEWFNSTGIAAAPGGQTLGWEGSVSGWKSARISLDQVKEKANGRPVRFRVAFASLELGDNRENKFDGFAFDNFAIRERNRMIVLEHFTNVNATNNLKENAYVDNFSEARSQEVIKIEYHTAYPGPDPMNKENMADPSAHVLEYGVSEVPRTVMDGIFGVHYRNDPFSTNEWGKSVYAKRTIIDAPFNLAISDTLIAGGDSQGREPEGLKIDVTITKNLTVDTIFAPLVLEIGILQKTVEVNGQSYHNVLRKLLPDAKGTYVNGDWMPDDLSRTETVTEYWNPKVEYNPSDTFLIVAYIHDTHLTKIKSKEIYQGAYKKVSVVPPKARVTGLDKNKAVGVNLFPNPAKGDVNLVFDQPLMQSSEVKVYSPNGVVVFNAVMDKGAKTFRIPLENYPSGLYIVSFYAQGQMVKRQLVLR